MNKKNFRKLINSKTTAGWIPTIPNPTSDLGTCRTVKTEMAKRGDPKLDRLQIGKSVRAVRKVTVESYHKELGRYEMRRIYFDEMDEDGESQMERSYREEEYWRVLRPTMVSQSTSYSCKKGLGNGTIVKAYHPQVRTTREYRPVMSLSEQAFQEARNTPLYQSNW